VLNPAVRASGHRQAIARTGEQAIKHQPQQEEKKMHQTTPHVRATTRQTLLRAFSDQAAADEPQPALAAKSTDETSAARRTRLAATTEHNRQ
jgi:hypothetical protein